MNELPTSFFHRPPEGYSYEVLPYKSNVVAVWTVCNPGFVYNGGNAVRCIWGFYNTKKQQYFAPINSKKVGDPVDINDTTPYTAMQLNLNPLEYALYSSS